MNAQTKIEPSPLAKLREPFADNLISKLPKPTKQQTEAVRNNFKVGERCKLCGAWHHPDVVHLDYVGHAALTHRLLDVDPHWAWEPVAFDDRGLPAFDTTGGLWIKLTVCDVTRYGYGHAASKPNQDPGAREKEAIGDALRNAAMRFGAALDLWHKGDLHAEDESEPSGSGGDTTGDRQISPTGPDVQSQDGMPDAEFSRIVQLVEATKTDTGKLLKHYGVKNLRQLNQDQYGEAVDHLNKRLAEMAKAESNAKAQQQQPREFVDIGDEDIPF